MDAVIVRYLDMPVGVPGITVKDPEGDYNIFLNSRLCHDQQVLAFRHEIEHIKNGDFYSYESVQEIEDRNPF